MLSPNMITLITFYGWLIQQGHLMAAADLLEMMKDEEAEPTSGQTLGLIGQVCNRYAVNLEEVMDYLAS